jgi:diguanylate cyclase (GGDEF)-like protein
MLQRVRLAALVFACSAPVSQFPLGIDGGLSAAARARGLVALALLVAFHVVTFARRRLPPLSPVIVSGLLLAAGLSLVDPMVVIGLSMGALVHLSLYGGGRAALVHGVTVPAAYLATIALSAAAAQRGLDWNSSIVLGNLPGIVGACALMRVLLASLAGQRQAAERDALLARTATALLGETDLPTIRRIAAEADAALGALQPGDGVDAQRVLAAQVSLAETSAAAHARLVHEAEHDQLTGLPNRAALDRLLAEAIDGGAAAPGAAVLHFDLDDFKAVNDTYGHTAGDELLVEVARRLRAVSGDAGLPARLGGDEFVLVLPGVTDPAESGRVAERLLAALSEPVELGETTLALSASVGIAHAAPGLTAGDVVRCADIAMYTAKDRGKHSVEHFDPAQHGRIARLRTLEEDLPHAVRRGEILVHYQPQVDLQTGRCHGVEALARWQHPRLGLVGPLEFIPVAERTGAIETIGAHVLRTACAQAAAWSELEGLGDLRLSVNVSARQLARDSLPGIVRSALADSGLPAERLTLELTESELLEGTLATERLIAIAGLGVRIAIDDFGTGYASLAYLRSLPVHQVKIDRSFVPGTADAAAGADDLARAVLLVGQALGLETIAEGVELSEQADALETAGVQVAQGYLFGRPMPGDAFARWITAADNAAVA